MEVFTSKRKAAEIVRPWIEDCRAASGDVSHVARREVEVMFKGGHCQHRVDDRWGMPRLLLHSAGYNAPTPHNRVGQRENPVRKATFQSCQGNAVAMAIGMITWKICDSLVVFGKRDHTDEKPGFIDGGRKTMHGGSALRVHQRSRHVGIQQEAFHSSMSRPWSSSRSIAQVFKIQARHEINEGCFGRRTS